jgi:hypothetical protein
VAQVTKVELIDDLSGDKADETVTFSLDGVVFDIDLSANEVAPGVVEFEVAVPRLTPALR